MTRVIVVRSSCISALVQAHKKRRGLCRALHGYQISRLATFSAFASMKSRRGSTASPINIENI
jgi:hypothetical protein